MIILVRWLNAFVNCDDCIPGVCWVGNNRGTLNSNWDIYDRDKLDSYIECFSTEEF